MPSRIAWRRRLKLLQAKLVLGMRLPEELRDAAMEALHDPCHSDALVALATLETPYTAPGTEASELFWSVAREQRLPPMPSLVALRRFAVHSCRLLLAGEITTDECARAIFDARIAAESLDSSRRGYLEESAEGKALARQLGHLAHSDRSDFHYDPPEFDRVIMQEAMRWASASPLGPAANSLDLDGTASPA